MHDLWNKYPLKGCVLLDEKQLGGKTTPGCDETLYPSNRGEEGRKSIRGKKATVTHPLHRPRGLERSSVPKKAEVQLKMFVGRNETIQKKSRKGQKGGQGKITSGTS